MSYGYNNPALNSDLPVLNEKRDQIGTTRWTQPWKNWMTQTFQIVFDVQNSGTTANRPTTNLYVGKPYFDTTLGIPIWYDGTNWIDAAGNTV